MLSHRVLVVSCLVVAALTANPARAQEKIFSVATDRPIQLLAISPSSSLIAVDVYRIAGARDGRITSGHNEIVVFNLAKEKTETALRFGDDDSAGMLSGIAFSLDGKSVIASGGSRSAAINYWDIETGEITRTFSPAGGDWRR